ncbi:MAG: SUMF1/EgtB/PvdO family nonheme iron enzyme [Rhizobiaceae bacterium]
MPHRATLRIFISSPADVRPERLKAEQVVARLDREFAHHFHVEAVLWEREPMTAAHHFQDAENIQPPSEADIVVVVLWSRLGVPLPHDRFRGAISGRAVTGTEWEFEDALAAARGAGKPDLLFYRKVAEPVSSLADRAVVRQRLEQMESVDDFVARWFTGDGGKEAKAAYREFSTTAEFEQQLYEHLRAAVARRATASAAAGDVRWHSAPFRGLLSYEFEHSRVFFGRTRARNELRELLVRQINAGTAFVLALGASGSGRSSLVKAGLLPDLMLPGMVERVALLRWCSMRPSASGGDPLAALTEAILSPTALPELAASGVTPEHLLALLSTVPEQAAVPIGQGLAAVGRAAGLSETSEARLVVVADQFEELFTVEGMGEAERAAFVTALSALAGSGLVWVVASMRSDFFDRIETIPALAAMSAGGRFLLLPPDRGEIGQIIRQPALEAGVRFEQGSDGIGLDEVIRQAAARDPNALPLLSFLLDQLWQRRTGDGTLTFAAYEELGGLHGAIGRRADEVFLAQPEAAQKAFVPLIRSLVTVEHGKATSRPAPLSLFPTGSPGRALADALLAPEARLLVSGSNGAMAELRLSHEALLTHWPRARDQVAEDLRDLALRERLETEAREWREAAAADRPSLLRAPGLPLAEARGLLRRWGEELPREVRDYIAASRSGAWQRRIRFSGAVAAALVAIPFALGLIWSFEVWRGVREVEARMEFVRAPAGCFVMGSAGNDLEAFANELPPHEACVEAFDIGRREVTQAEWRKVMVFINPEPSQFTGAEKPVEGVSWTDAELFIRLMSLFGRREYRLPNEAEWEYAARAGTASARHFGDWAEQGCGHENMADATLKRQDPDLAAATCNDGFANTAPVGNFRPNPWGLHDMLGNVAEWVSDCYRSDYLSPTVGHRPSEMTGCALHMVRGGSWSSVPRYLRAARRYGTLASVRSGDFGFRLARMD